MKNIKEKLKIKKLDIFVIFICLILFAYCVVIGSPLKQNTSIIDLIVLITFVIYFIVNITINKKYKLIRGKLDVFLLILVFSSSISLIFGNYSNLEKTIEYLIKYVSLYSLYIMIRDFVKKDKKYINYIIWTIIGSGIYIFIIGLDNITYNFSEKLMRLVDNVIVKNDDKRFMSAFGYANTCSILNLIISIIAIGKYLNGTNIKEKILLNITIFLNFVAIIMSYSRSIWLIAIVTYLIIIFIVKNKKIDYLELLLRIAIFSVIYSLLAIKLINGNNYLIVWGMLVLFAVIIIVSNYISEKIKRIISKIKIKYIVIISIVLIIITIIIICVGINQKAPLVIFDDIFTKKVPTQDINNVTPNTNYKFEFNIDAKVAYGVESIYEIEISERNIYDDIIKTHKIEFGEFKGTKELEVTTTEYTYKFLIRFNSKLSTAQRGLIINSMKINGKEEAVNYKYLPIRLVDKIKDIKLNTISVRGRAIYVEDTLKLISKYGLIGIGADGWKDRRVEVQEYYDIASEPHSYILEVFCEYGILGFIALVLIFIYIVKKLIDELKKKDKDLFKISIILSFIILFIHSTIDFNLSFMYMLVIFFILLALINNEEKNYKVIDIISKVVIVLLSIICICFNSNICISKYIKKEENPYSQEYVYNLLEKENDINIKENLDEMVDRRKYVSHISEFKTLIYSKALNEEEYYKMYEIIKSEENLLKYDAYMRLEEIKLYNQILNELDVNLDKYNSIKDNIILRIEKEKELLNEPLKCRLNLEEIDNLNKELEKIENEVKG